MFSCSEVLSTHDYQYLPISGLFNPQRLAQPRGEQRRSPNARAGGLVGFWCILVPEGLLRSTYQCVSFGIGELGG